MKTTLLIFTLLIQYGVTTEIYPVYAHGKDEIILQLPEHLQQIIVVEYNWQKEKKHIATGYGNGTLHILDPKYSGLLSSSPNGSLIIKDTNWKVGDEYSVDIIPKDNSPSSINYRVNSYIRRDTGPTFVHIKAGEVLIMPLEGFLIEQSDIEEIDWVTEKWVYFAATRVGGKIRILKDIYDGSLSSTPNGSLIFTKATMADKGVYRACILSRKGIILEQTYQVYVNENDGGDITLGKPASIKIKMSILLCVTSISLFIIIIGICIMYLHKKKEGANEGCQTPKITVKTKKSHDKSHIVNFPFCFTHTKARNSPRLYPYFDAVVGLAWSKDSESFIGDSTTIIGVTHAGQVSDDDPDKKGYLSGGDNLY